MVSPKNQMLEKLKDTTSYDRPLYSKIQWYFWDFWKKNPTALEEDFELIYFRTTAKINIASKWRCLLGERDWYKNVLTIASLIKQFYYRISKENLQKDYLVRSWYLFITLWKDKFKNRLKLYALFSFRVEYWTYLWFIDLVKCVLL